MQKTFISCTVFLQVTAPWIITVNSFIAILMQVTSGWIGVFCSQESFVCWTYLRERVFGIVNRRASHELSTNGFLWPRKKWYWLQRGIYHYLSSTLISIKSTWANSVSVIHSSCKWIWTGQKNKKDDFRKVSDILILTFVILKMMVLPEHGNSISMLFDLAALNASWY